jgi:hypothetical protein
MNKEISIHGLAYNCPVQNREMDCPFIGIDHFSFKEKVKWVEGLSKEENEAIQEHHQRCTRNR